MLLLFSRPKWDLFQIVHLARSARSFYTLAICGDRLLVRALALTIVRTAAVGFVGMTDQLAAPLGNRRRFGPAPVEESAPPQLAQPSPSAYPRFQSQNDRESPRPDRDTTPSNGAGEY